MTETKAFTSEDFVPPSELPIVSGRSVIDGIVEVDPRNQALTPQDGFKKVLVTLDIGNYQPAIKALTMPLMKAYADKIGAEFVSITERKYPEWPIVLEKFQCAEIGKQKRADWVVFFDADALISPEMFDVTLNASLDTVLFNGKDMSQIRFKSDKYFERDGRFIGACDWFCCSSRLCYEDLYTLPIGTPEESFRNIAVTIQEHNSGMFHDNHLIDDYTLSRNIARFGLKHDTLIDICGRMGIKDQFGRGANPWLWHLYSMTEEQKLERMIQLLSTPQDRPVDAGGGRQMRGWQIMNAKQAAEFKSRLFKNERGQWDLRS